MEEERKRFMDAAVKLGKERALFEQERDEFEQARMAVETQQVLKNLPSTPAWLKNSYNQLIKDKTLETPTAVVSRVTATAAINGHASHNSNEHAIEAIDKALANADLNNHNNQENVKSANVNKGKPPIMSTPGGALPAYLFQKSKQSPFDTQMSEIDQQTVENNTSPINNLTAVNNYKRQPLTSKVTFQE